MVQVRNTVNVMINMQQHEAIIQEISHPYYIVKLVTPIKHGSADYTEIIKVHVKHVNVTKM